MARRPGSPDTCGLELFPFLVTLHGGRRARTSCGASCSTVTPHRPRLSPRSPTARQIDDMRLEYRDARVTLERKTGWYVDCARPPPQGPHRQGGRSMTVPTIQKGGPWWTRFGHARPSAPPDEPLLMAAQPPVGELTRTPSLPLNQQNGDRAHITWREPFGTKVIPNGAPEGPEELILAPSLPAYAIPQSPPSCLRVLHEGKSKRPGRRLGYLSGVSRGILRAN